MRKITNCKNCGATLTGNHCYYCGTEYDDIFSISPIIITPQKVSIFRAKSTVPNEFIDDNEDFIKNIYKDLAYRLACELLDNDCIFIDKTVTSDDMLRCCTTFIANIRVLQKYEKI